MLLFADGSETAVMSDEQLRHGLCAALDKLAPRRKVLLVPPDHTRIHSGAGKLAVAAWHYYGTRVTDVLPALGTHRAMTPAQIATMFGDLPIELFRTHRWRHDVVTLGAVPAEFVKEVSAGAVDYDWPVQVNRLLKEGGFDLILSLGQVVPHEVIGMANQNKNIFVGTGGAESIHKSHFLGAAYGMERIMGRADTPVRRVLNYGAERYARDLPIVYVLTVLGRNEEGTLRTRGLFIGDDDQCFKQAADLSARVNIEIVPEPLDKVVVYLDPGEYKSTWLGNKSIYRTRMALADGAELIVLAPGLKQFGEDAAIDAVIRKHGYRGTPAILEAVRQDEDLQQNLSGAAHLIHGSSEGRFRIVYCPGHVTQEEIEGVGFDYADLETMLTRYDPATLRDGPNRLPGGERIFFISNPATGLWTTREKLERA